MLVFKKNIYYILLPPTHLSPTNRYQDHNDPSPTAFNFIRLALNNALHLIEELLAHEDGQNQRAEGLGVIYPHISRFTSVETMHQLCRILLEGLTDNKTWYGMNCYHQCFLYDCLLDVVEEYHYNDGYERKALIPEMDCRNFDFNRFLLEYFFNTAFLIAAERYNNMTPEDKQLLRRSPDFGDTFRELKRFDDPEDPTLTKVINKVPPSEEELRLIPFDYDPYLQTG